MKKCSYCNEIIKDGETYTTHDNDIICESCYTESFSYCDCCNKIHHNYDGLWLENCEEWICDDCLNSYYTQCDECGEYFKLEDTYGAYNSFNHQVNICEHCGNDLYYYCDDCGNLCHSDIIHYNEEDDRYYCDDCYENHQDNIYSYHEFSEWQEYKLENEEPPYYIGFELEVDDGRDNKNCSEYVTDNINAICTHDGSLNNGFEIISHPQSYKYLTSQDTKDKMRDVFDHLKSSGYKSHDTDTCGLHFHITRPLKSEIIDRIILVMETYKEELIMFSRRTSSQMHWCEFLSDKSDTDKNILKGLYYVKKCKNKDTTRYMALNLTNDNTIEFRLMRGTLNFDTFYACVELINNIVSQCSNLSKDIIDINWTTLTQGEYVGKYIESKNIHTTKLIENDTTQEEKVNKLLELKNTVCDECISLYVEQTTKLLDEYQRVFRTACNECLELIYIELDKKLSMLKGNIDLLNCVKRRDDILDVKRYIHSFIREDYLSRIPNDEIDRKLHKLQEILESEEI